MGSRAVEESERQNVACTSRRTGANSTEEPSFFSFVRGLSWILKVLETGKTLGDVREECCENVRVDSLYLSIICGKKPTSIVPWLRKFRICFCRHRSSFPLSINAWEVHCAPELHFCLCAE